MRLGSEFRQLIGEGNSTRWLTVDWFVITVMTIMAQFLANLIPLGYERIGGLTHFWVNEVLMAMFFTIAGKEVWESFLPKGRLSAPGTRGTVIGATLGGVAVPGLIFYLVAHSVWGREVSRGWAIPTATDIIFSSLIMRYIYGKEHGAYKFLLLLAVVDDAIGMGIIAAAYPVHPLQPMYLITLVPAGVGAAYLLGRKNAQDYRWYLFGAGGLCWLGFYLGGLHAALAPLLVIPFVPHEAEDRGVLAEIGHPQLPIDPLNAFEEAWKYRVTFILGAFALVNAGVAIGPLSWVTGLVTMSLLLGKPLGVVGVSAILLWAARRYRWRFRLPDDIEPRDLPVIGAAASIGCIVAIFVTNVAFEAPVLINAAKLGALFSFPVGAIFAFSMAYMLKVGRFARSSR